MKRRDVLAGVTAGAVTGATSGCLQRVLGCDSEALERKEVTSAPGYRNYEVSASCGAQGFELDAALVQAASDDEPAAFKTQLVCTGQSSKTVRGSWVLPMAAFDATVQGQTLHIVPEVGHVGPANEPTRRTVSDESQVSSCWVAGEINAGDVGLNKTFEPCETHTMDYRLYGDTENKECVPRGTYVFEDTYTVDDQQGELETTIEVTVTD